MASDLAVVRTVVSLRPETLDLLRDAARARAAVAGGRPSVSAVVEDLARRYGHELAGLSGQVHRAGGRA